MVDKDNISKDSGIKGFASDSIVIKTKENGQVEPVSEEGNSLLEATLNVFDEKYINSNSIKPRVLIYHTHTGEAFVPYQASSRNENENIMTTMHGTKVIKKTVFSYSFNNIHL